VRLGEGHDDGVDGRSPSSPCSKFACPPRDALGQDGIDVAALQQPVHVRVSSRSPGDRFRQDSGRHDRRPQSLAVERPDEPRCSSGTLGELAQSARVEDEHSSAGEFSFGPLPDPPSDRFPAGDITRRGFTNVLQ
jgi:hypothetical protein